MEGGVTAVSVQQAAIRLTLVNQSSLTTEEANSARQKDPNLKVIPDAQVQQLLDLFGGSGFFDIAGSAAETRSQNWIMVQHGEEPYVAASSFQTPEQLAAWTDCLQVFTHVYNNNDSFTSSAMSAEDLQRASDEINQSSQAARAKKIKKQ